MLPPLISVILCTHNRPALLPRALASVLDQDEQAPFEVILVDDGSEPPAQIPPPGDGRVRLVRIRHGGAGAARSAGLRAAEGSFIAYCDDDDDWTPDHLSVLLAHLRDHVNVDLVYADSAWEEEEEEPSVPYSFPYDRTLLHSTNYIFATDVMHRADAAREVGGFDASLPMYEDWELWMRMSRRHAFEHIPRVLATHYWHGDCLSAGATWDDAQRVFERQQRHGDLYRKDRAVVPFDRRTWEPGVPGTPGRRELIWHSPMNSEHSFCIVSSHLVRALARDGVAIMFDPYHVQAPDDLAPFAVPFRGWERLSFWYDSFDLRHSMLSDSCERIVTYAMWESTSVPERIVDQINSHSILLYVPCRQNAEAFEACGVRVPIKVLHHGVDTRAFSLIQRQRSDYFTFGTFGDFQPRKGIDVLIRAFTDEFRPGESVRLLMKSTKDDWPYETCDPRITILSGFLDHGRLMQLLGEMDAFVLPSRGEGFGLCGLEAMATGLPLVATNWSGPCEYLDPSDSYPLAFELVEADRFEDKYVRHGGLWAEPDYEHLRYLMRRLYEHREEAAAKGRAAARRVQEQWTWQRPARQLRDDLDALSTACRRD